MDWVTVSSQEIKNTAICFQNVRSAACGNEKKLMIQRTLQTSYTIFSPIYDFVVDWPTRVPRQQNLTHLPQTTEQTVLLCGIGSGLDIPYLPVGPHYIGIDFTWAMLKRAKKRVKNQKLSLHQGNVMQLPYADNSFDQVIMHLILAVVSDPQLALAEATRVLKPQGQLLIFDKFLKAQQFAPVRRWLSPLIANFATRTDVVFEQLQNTQLTLVSDEPALANGWFRLIRLNKVG